MVRDRLKELRMNQNSQLENGDEDEKFIITIGDGDIDQLYKNVESINQNIDLMVSLVDDIKKIHSTMLSTPITVDEKIKQALEDININFKLLSKKTKENLQGIQAEYVSLEAKNDTNTAAYRIRTTQYSVLQKRLMEAINLYNIAQIDYREKCKERLQRQLEITGRSTTDDELDKMLENPNPEVFTQGIITETKLAKQQLAEITERHADIIKIEKSIRELHDMFVDMAMLVEQQGEMIDRIETHVQSTYDFVEKAREQTKQAMEYQTKARKLKIIITIIVIIIVLLILFSIFY